MTHRRVLRYTIDITRTAIIPAGVPVLFGRTTRNQLPGLEALLDVWMEVTVPDDWPTGDTPHRQQEVTVYGTGHPIPEDARWLASYIDGDLVWHLYTLREIET